MSPRRNESGYSLIEVAIVLAITAILLVATFSIVLAVTRGDESIRTRVDLQLEATQVLRQLTALLKASGPQENLVPGTIPPQGNGKFDFGVFPPEFPAFATYNADTTGPKWGGNYSFLNNQTAALPPPPYPSNSIIIPQLPFTDSDIYPPVLSPAGGGTQTPGLAGNGSPGAPTVFTVPLPPGAAAGAVTSINNVEIAFRVPKTLGGVDDQGNFKLQPITLTNGAVEWGTEVLVIALAPGQNFSLDANGKINGGYFGNELQLRMYAWPNGNLDRKIVLARNVERILFESAGFTYPGNVVVGNGTSFYGTGNYDSSLGTNEMRVTIWLVKPDANGKLVKVKATSTFNFRSILR